MADYASPAGYVASAGKQVYDSLADSGKINGELRTLNVLSCSSPSIFL